MRLNGTVEPSGPTSIGDVDGDGVEDLSVKFLRSDLLATLGAGSPVTVSVSGDVGSSCFQTTDELVVKPSLLAAPTAGVTLAAGSELAVSWVPEPGFATVDLILSGDDGLSWSIVARDVANSGEYAWTVPGVNTSLARFGVSKIATIDETGLVLSHELSESGTFAITSPLGVGSGALEFAVRGVSPNPAPGAFKVDFTLPNNRPASIGIFDVAGRQVASREVGSMGPGQHSVEFGRRETLKAGLYLVRVTQGDRTVTARAVVAW